MKWMIAATLAGSTAIVPVAINEVEMNGKSIQFDFVEKNTQEFTIPVDPVFKAKRLREAELHEFQYWIDKKASEVRDKRKQKITNVLDKLKGYVGKTQYVFSGASPNGWDCSGLVLWTYSHLGIALPHSVSAQRSSGPHVSDPRPGDIVVWNSYHSGIYLGDGLVLHAYNSRRDTVITPVNEIYGNVTYVRVYDY
jgi:cell wall-associated NlpC family hydrolase